MKYTPEQRQQIIEQTRGQVISSLDWDEEGGYWVMTLADGTEACFRFMAELV